MIVGEGAEFLGPSAELRQEEFVGHGDAELAPLHGFGAFVSGLELGVHPLVTEEAGTVFGDAVATHIRLTASRIMFAP